jgi:hypothetical protein
MNYYNDPTASKAIGNINREFNRLEKKAKNLVRLYYQGKISSEALKKAQGEFKGLYSHILKNAINTPKNEE